MRERVVVMSCFRGVNALFSLLLLPWLASPAHALMVANPTLRPESGPPRIRARVQTNFGKGLVLREELPDGRPGPSSGIVLQPGTQVEIDPDFLMARMASADVSPEEKERFFKQQACEIFGSAWNGIASKRSVGGRTYHYVRVISTRPGQAPRSGLVSLEYLAAEDLFDCESLFKSVIDHSISQSITCNEDCAWENSPITPLIRQWAELLPEMIPATEVSPGVDLLKKLEGFCGGESPKKTPPADFEGDSRPVITTTVEEPPQVEVLDDPTQYFAASVEQIRKASCLRTTPFSDEEIDREIQALSSSRVTPQSKRVYGYELRDEHPFLIDLFEKLTTPTKGGNVAQRPTLVSNCQKVDCAVREVFGDDLGPRLLVILGKYGLNGSHLAFDHASPWRKDELDLLLLALNDFPAGTLRLEENQRFTHYTRGSAPESMSPFTLANGTINFFDLWNTYDPEERRMTVFHELAHHLSHQANGESPRLSEIDLWQPSGKRPTYISLYALENSGEDLAESAVAYRYRPDELLRRNPEKYDFLKEVFFDGVEFTSKSGESGCRNSRPRFVETLREVEEQIQKELDSPSPELTSRVLQDCGLQLLSGLREDLRLNAQDFQGANPCIAGSVASALVDELPMDPGLRYPELVKSSLKRRFATHPLNEVRLDALIPESRKQLREHLHALFTLHDGNTGYSYSQDQSVTQFCAGWAKYIAVDAEQSGLKTALAPRAYYSDLMVLQPISIRVCELVHEGKKPREHMKAEEISSALDQMFGGI